MLSHDRHIWKNYKRMPNVALCEQLDVDEKELRRRVRQIGLYYFGNRWVQRLSAEITDDKFRKDNPPEAIRAKCAEIRATWDEQTEYDRRVIKTPCAKVLSTS